MDASFRAAQPALRREIFNNLQKQIEETEKHIEDLKKESEAKWEHYASYYSDEPSDTPPLTPEMEEETTYYHNKITFYEGLLAYLQKQQEYYQQIILLTENKK